MSIVVSSTTDSQEAVNAAAGLTSSEAAQVESPDTETSESATEEARRDVPPEKEPGEHEPAEEDDDSEDEESPPPAPKKKGGYLRKIEQLERERGYMQRRLEEYESALAGQRKPAASETQPQGPKPKPAQDQFQSYEDYVEALTDWKTDQKLEQRERDLAQKAREWHAQEQERQRLAGWEQRVGEFKSTAADFDDVLLQAEHIQLSPVLQQSLMESESGPQLAYELAKDPKELERIAKLPPLAAVRALGAFEARTLAAEKPAPKQAAPPPVSKAPPPVKAIANGSATTAAKRLDDPDIEFQDWKRLRNRDIAAARGRGY